MTGRQGGAGHVDDGRDPAAGRLGAAVEEVLAGGEARLVEVHMGIDGAGKDEEARGVDDLFARAGSRLSAISAIRSPRTVMEARLKSASPGRASEAVAHDHGLPP